jgi:glycosyltransferase involved in cell wall biosynthesis
MNVIGHSFGTLVMGILLNDERILPHILKIWSTYPVDLFIFYDDNSTDLSVEIIKQFLPEERVIIINDRLPKFNESYNRQKMLDVARENKVDFVLSIDCDELLTSNIVKNFNDFIKIYNEVISSNTKHSYRVCVISKVGNM